MFYLHDLIQNAAQSSPQKTAVIKGEIEADYVSIFSRSLKVCSVLKNLGIGKGDRVCLYTEKNIEKVISIFAISMLGAIMVPVRRILKPYQLAFIIENCKASALIASDTGVEAYTEFITGKSPLKTIIKIGNKDIYRTSVLKHIKIISWEEAINNPVSSYIETQIAENDPAAILYTSGSTGKPKGVILTHQNILAGAEKVSEYLKITEDDRLLSVLTFSFDYGLNQLTTAFLRKAQIVLLEYLFPRDVIKAVTRYKITGLAAVSTIWNQLLQISWDGSLMSSLRYITNSGGAVSQNNVLELKKRLPDTDIYLMYGLTEAFRSTFLDPGLVDKFPNSIGKAIPGEEVFVLDGNNNRVKPGEIGEIIHRGVLVSKGYWNDPETTSARFKPNPEQNPAIPIHETVVYSGDYATIDENGLIYFIGRKDETIKCAGNRISPTEVEEILYSLKYVSEAVAFGIPHEVYGEAVFVVLTQKKDTEIDLKKIFQQCKEIMPPFMVPKQIEIRDKLPYNSNGKIDRQKIKKDVFLKLGINKVKFPE